MYKRYLLEILIEYFPTYLDVTLREPKGFSIFVWKSCSLKRFRVCRIRIRFTIWKPLNIVNLLINYLPVKFEMLCILQYSNVLQEAELYYEITFEVQLLLLLYIISISLHIIQNWLFCSNKHITLPIKVSIKIKDMSSTYYSNKFNSNVNSFRGTVTQINSVSYIFHLKVRYFTPLLTYSSLHFNGTP